MFIPIREPSEEETVGKMIVLALVTVLFAMGCSLPGQSGPAPRANDTFFYVYRNPSGTEVLGVTPTVMSADGLQWEGGGVRALVTNNPADEEFWQYEVHINTGTILNAIGTQAKCEASRNANAKLTSLTEPCRGPYYFRRER